MGQLILTLLLIHTIKSYNLFNKYKYKLFFHYEKTRIIKESFLKDFETKSALNLCEIWWRSFSYNWKIGWQISAVQNPFAILIWKSIIQQIFYMHVNVIKHKIARRSLNWKRLISAQVEMIFGLLNFDFRVEMTSNPQKNPKTLILQWLIGFKRLS